MAKAKTEPTLSFRKLYGNKPALAETQGKSLTIPGESSEIADLFKAHVSGFPIPMAHEEIVFPELSELTEDRFDVPDVITFSRMDISDQRNIQNNLSRLVQDIKGKAETLQHEYKLAQEATQKPEPVTANPATASSQTT